MEWISTKEYSCWASIAVADTSGNVVGLEITTTSMVGVGEVVMGCGVPEHHRVSHCRSLWRGADCGVQLDGWGGSAERSLTGTTARGGGPWPADFRGAEEELVRPGGLGLERAPPSQVGLGVGSLELGLSGTRSPELDAWWNRDRATTNDRCRQARSHGACSWLRRLVTAAQSTGSGCMRLT